MKQIKSADAFAFALIRENPNLRNKDVQEMIRNMPKDLQKIARNFIKKENQKGNRGWK